MNWIHHPVVLTGTKVKLVPLDHEHFDGLLEVASDKRIWEFFSVDCSDKNRLLSELKSAVLKRMSGEQYPFVVYDQLTGKMIGSTMLHSMMPNNRKLEIGWTWYHPDYWRTGYNRECKLLLLEYCFEVLQTIRVQFFIDEVNTRSRKGVEGLGATFEGILRNERIRTNGTIRNSAVYSIIDSEWPLVKEQIKSRIKF